MYQYSLSVLCNFFASLVCMRSASGDECRARDSAGSNPRLCLKKRNFLKNL